MIYRKENFLVMVFNAYLKLVSYGIEVKRIEGFDISVDIPTSNGEAKEEY